MIAGFEQPTPGQVAARGGRRLERPALQAQRQHGVPAVRPVPAHVGARQRGVRPARQEGARCRGRCAGPRRCSTSSSSASSRGADPTSCRAASSSGSPWPGRWSTCPSALLLDEPLAALDLKLREAMQIELKRIQREVGITFIFVTHDQHEALTMSDRIAVMSRGRVEQIGTPGGDLRATRRASSSPASSGRPTCCRALVAERAVAGRALDTGGRIARRVGRGLHRRRPGHGDDPARAAQPGGERPSTGAACAARSTTPSSRAPRCG